MNYMDYKILAWLAGYSVILFILSIWILRNLRDWYFLNRTAQEAKLEASIKNLSLKQLWHYMSKQWLGLELNHTYTFRTEDVLPEPLLSALNTPGTCNLLKTGSYQRMIQRKAQLSEDEKETYCVTKQKAGLNNHLFNLGDEFIEVKTLDSKGLIRECVTYAYGVCWGAFDEFFADGTLKYQEHHVAGYNHGPMKGYWAPGKPKVFGQYRYGYEHGWFEYYDEESGELFCKVEFHFGYPVQTLNSNPKCAIETIKRRFVESYLGGRTIMYDYLGWVAKSEVPLNK